MAGGCESFYSWMNMLVWILVLQNAANSRVNNSYLQKKKNIFYVLYEKERAGN